MNRKTIGALLVFLVLLGLVYYLQTRPEKGERLGPRPRPVPQLEDNRIRKVTITAKGSTVVLERQDKAWKVSSPAKDDADSQATKTMVDKLVSLEFGDMVTERRDRHAEHGVDTKSAIHVVVHDGKQTSADFLLGKVIDGFTMLRASGKDQVYQAVGTLSYVFEREPKNWRARTVIRFNQQDARKLEISTVGAPGIGSILLSRTDEKADWKVERSDVAVQQLDRSAVSGLLSGLANLTAFDFADRTSPEEAGLAEPTATLAVHLKGGERDSLLIGKRKGEDYWVQHVGDPQIFIVKKYAVGNLLRRPVDFRDKTVLSFEPPDVVRLIIRKVKDGSSVNLVRKGNAWLGDGKKVADTSKLKQALETLSKLRAEGIAWHSARDLGLDRPDWEIAVWLKDRTRHLIRVGSVEQDGRFGLTRKGGTEIFTLRKYTLDRFLLEPKDYR